MRWVGVDVGRKRVGLAMSDASASVARPWETIAAGGSVARTCEAIARRLDAFDRETFGAEPVAGFVVGLPRRLGGEDTDQTATARQLASALTARTGLVAHLQDERLTSREAEARLAETERDWRVRKTQIDAVAASIILQDFLDAASAKRQSGDDQGASACASFEP